MVISNKERNPANAEPDLRLFGAMNILDRRFNTMPAKVSLEYECNDAVVVVVVVFVWVVWVCKGGIERPCMPVSVSAVTVTGCTTAGTT